MKIARWKHNSYAEGPCPNTTFWLSGCSLRCKGCFNPQLWDGKFGQNLPLPRLLVTIRKGQALGDRGAAFVGGEPMDQSVSLGWLCLAARLFFPGMVLTVYTGYTLEALRRNKDTRLVLSTAHYLVDGPFVFDRSDPNLGYRGSSNQRVIDLAATRKSGFRKIALANWDNLIVYRNGMLSGPPAVMEKVGNTHASECGKYGLEKADPPR